MCTKVIILGHATRRESSTVEFCRLRQIGDRKSLILEQMQDSNYISFWNIIDGFLYPDQTKFKSKIPDLFGQSSPPEIEGDRRKSHGESKGEGLNSL